MPRTAPARILRLGLVIGDQLVDERQVAPGTVVTIGQSLDCTFAIAVESLPRRWVLIDAQGELKLAPGMTAKRDGERGRVRIGEITVLFQEQDAHEERAMPLPADLRPSVLRRMDRRLAAFVAGSILLHAGIATAAWMHDGQVARPRVASTLAMTDPPMVDLLTAMPFDPADLAPGEPDAPGPIAKPQPPAPGVATPPVSRPIGGGGNRKPTLPEMTPEEYLKAIHGGGGGPGDLPALPALPDVGDVDAPGPGDDDDRGPRVRDPIGPAGPGDRDVDGPGDVTDIDKDPVAPIPKDPKPPKDPEPEVDADWIAKVVQKIKTTYMAGLERCQKKLMAQDPFANNTTVKISLTVGADGKVTSSKARSDEPTINACVGDQMDGWSFPAPPTGKDSHVAVTLALQGS